MNSFVHFRILVYSLLVGVAALAVPSSQPALRELRAIGPRTAGGQPPAVALASSTNAGTVMVMASLPPALVNPGDQINADPWSYAEAVASDGPVSYWRLNTLVGSSAIDSVGPNPGAGLGGLATGQPGALADSTPAMRFDGGGYIRVPDFESLRVTGDLTLELWLNVALGGRQTLLSKGYLHEFELTLEADGTLNLYQGNGAGYSNAASTGGAVTTGWHHVVVTREAPAQTVRFYVDGISRGTKVSAIAPTASDTDLSIGRSVLGSQHVNGSLGEVAIYAAALGPARIARHFAMRTATATTAPVELRVVVENPAQLPLTFAATGLPPGLAIGLATGIVSGTLRLADAGAYPVTISVSDGAASASQSFIWTVTTTAGTASLAFSGDPANPRIDVTALGKVAYRYSVNDAPYSAELPLTKPITLAADIDLAGRRFNAGTTALGDFINLQQTDDSFAEFFGDVTFDHLESQTQVTYLVNRIRTAVGPDNVLTLGGAGVGGLAVEMYEGVPPGPRYELSAFAVSGGSLRHVSSTDGNKAFVLSLPQATGAITITPRTNNDQTAIAVNGQAATSGEAVAVSLSAGSSIVLRTVGPDGSVTTYSIECRYDDGLVASEYRSVYLRAFAPASAHVRVQNPGPSLVRYRLTFNQKFGLTRQELVREITDMPPEYPGEPMPRKVWRFIRDNRYHFDPLTRARWNQSPALFFSSIGFGFCNDAAALFYHLATSLGYPARVWDLDAQHTVPEAFVDGRWELWDPDLQVYYLNRAGRIAGVEELAADPDLVRHPLAAVSSALPDAYSDYMAQIYSTTSGAQLNASVGDLPALNDGSMLFDIPAGAAFEFPGVYDSPLSSLYLARVPAFANARLTVPEGFSGSVSTPLVVQSVGWSNRPRVAVVTKDAFGRWDSRSTVATWALDLESPFTSATQPSGVYNPTEPVTLTSSEPASIYYTVDGSPPSEASLVYSGPIAITPGETVRFFGIDSAGNREQLRSYGPAVAQAQLQMSSLLASVVTFTAGATGGSGDYEYSFRLYDPNAGWSTVRSFSEANTWSLNRLGATVGRYTVEVLVRNRGSKGGSDGSAAVSFDLRGEEPPSLVSPGDRSDPDVATYADATRSDAPVGYWRLNETSGTSASDIMGTAPATYVGEVTLGRPGALVEPDGSMTLDGAGYLRVDSPAGVALNADLTLELWVKVSLAARQTLLSKDYLHEFELTLETSGNLNLYHGNGTACENVMTQAGVIRSDTWQHVVVTRSAATKIVRFFVDGVLVKSGAYSLDPTVSTRPIAIGRSNDGVGYVRGSLDEVAVYSQPLGETRVLSHHALRLSDGTGTPIELRLVAQDADGDVVTYGASGLPPGLTVDGATGLIAGTLTAASVGTHAVMVTASDGVATSSESFTWTVTHVNHGPTLASVANQTSAENTSVSVVLVGADADGNALTYSATGLPEGVTVNAATGVIAGTPTFTSAGTYAVTATVSAGAQSASRSFTWTVTNTNRAPVLTNPGAQTHLDNWGYAQGVRADQPVAYWRLGESSGLTAADSAGTNPAMIGGGVTLGQSGALTESNGAMQFNGTTGVLQAADAAALRQTGDLTLELWVNVSLATRQTLMSKTYLGEFELTLETSGHVNFYQGTGTSYENVASAANAVTANTWQQVVVTRTASTKTIRFYVNGVLKGSGSYRLTPAASARAVVIGRSVGGTQYVNGRLDEVAIYGTALTAAQVSGHYALRTATGVGTPIGLQLTASDPDGDAVTYGASGLPPGLTVDGATGLITGTLTAASVGTHAVTVTASDGMATSSESFTWTVTNTNRAPVLANPGAQTHLDNWGYAQGVQADQPVAYWRLGESSGLTAADSAGTNPAMIGGGVTLGQSGALTESNGAMQFNGTTGVLQAADAVALRQTGDLTLELWVNVSLATRQTLMSKTYLGEFELTLETSGHVNFYQGTGTSYENVASAANAVTANTWQHVVVTRTVSTKTIRFYVNGVLKGSGSYTLTPAASARAVVIGRSVGGTQYVNGRLDEVAIYGTALTAAQVSGHYALRTATGVGTPIGLQLTASDPDGDAVTYGASGLPPGLTVDGATGLITGTLTAASVGTYTVTVTASDGAATTMQSFTWTVRSSGAGQ